MQLEPLPLTATVKLAIHRALADVHEDKREKALRLIAEVLLDNVSKMPPPRLENEQDEDFWLRVVGSFAPRPWSLASTWPAEVRFVFAEVLTSFGPRGATTTATPPTAAITVETTGEKELRDKTMSLHGYTFMKHAQGSWTLWYPNHWMSGDKTRPGDKCFAHWRLLWSEFTRGYSLTDRDSARMTSIERMLDGWFEITEGLALEAVLPGHLKQWFAIMDLLGETFLLMRNVSLQACQLTATAMFASVNAHRRHTGKPIDYFTSLTEARCAKEIPKNLFRQ